MQITPALSVIITCFNYENFVGCAINSVLSQARSNVELIVVDDGSADGSWEVISRLAKLGSFVARRQANEGQVAACRTGLKASSGSHVMFLDADDELAPGAIDAILAVLGPEVSKVQVSLGRIDSEGRRVGTHISVPDRRGSGALRAEVLQTGVHDTPPTSGNIFRKDLLALLEEVDYDRAVDGVILFAAPFFGEVVSVAAELVLYRLHDVNDSRSGKPPTAGTILRDLKRFEDRHAHLARVLSRLGQPAPVAARDAFFYRERRLYLDVIEGRGPRSPEVLGLLLTLMRHPMGRGRKIALAGVTVLLAILPNNRARALLNERFLLSGRGLSGFASAVFLGRRAVAAGGDAGGQDNIGSGE